STCARVTRCGTAPDVQKWSSGPLEVLELPMKKTTASTDSEHGPPREVVNQHLEKTLPDFFAEARFQVGDADYFLYPRFGQYLARTIEQNRASREKINRGFTVLNK